MNPNHSTDLEIAKNLDTLSKIIDQAHSKIRNIWQKIQQVDGVQQLIQDIESASQDLTQSKQLVEEAISEIDKKKKESLETIKSEAGQILEQIKAVEKRIIETVGKSEPLIRKLSELTSDHSVLQHMQSILDETKQCQSLLAQALDDLKANQQQVEQDKQFICRAEDQAREVLNQIRGVEERIERTLNSLELLTTELEENRQFIETIKHDAWQILEQVESAQEQAKETLANLEQLLGRLDEVIGGRSVLQHVQYILDETKKYQFLLEQALHDLQTNRQQVEQDKDFIYRAENQTREILSQINQALVNLQVSQQKVETNKQAVEEANRNTGEILQQINQALSDLRVSQQKVETDKQIIQDIEDRIKRTLEQAHQVLIDLELIRNLPTKLRRLGITDSIVRKTDELLDRSIALSKQLEECRQETMAIREFEEYVRQFRKYRSGKQLRSFLYRELGFAGLVVYILHLLAPRRRNG